MPGKWQRRRELMAKVKEEDENPAAPPPGGACSPRPSRSWRASTSAAMTRWRATSLASMRPRPLGSRRLQAKDVQRLLL